MARFLELTDSRDRKPVLINLDQVISVRPGAQGGTQVRYAFASGESKSVEITNVTQEYDRVRGLVMALSD